ncbi:MAG: hypothetical protein O2782_16910 [bacterium]|nr:hypothetical protein [bacterium]
MWLGILALLVAFSYAIVKFLTALHMRRMTDVHLRLLNDVKRDRQRLQTIETKLQVLRSQRGAVEQKLANARRFKEDLFGRLRLELPSTQMADLRQCVNRHPIPEPEGVRTAHDLHLADKVTAALTSLSILVVEIGLDGEAEGAHTVLAGELVNRLNALGANFTGPAPRRDAPEGSPEVLTTAFDEPATALELVTTLGGAAHPQQIRTLRAVLVAGITITEFDQEHVNRLFARTLHSTRQLLEDAEPGCVVVNERAHELLGDRPGLLPVEGPEKLWVAALGPANSATETGPASGDSRADSGPDGGVTRAEPVPSIRPMVAGPDPDQGLPATPEENGTP